VRRPEKVRHGGEAGNPATSWMLSSMKRTENGGKYSRRDEKFRM
jgi:hypothetical protein